MSISASWETLSDHLSGLRMSKTCSSNCMSRGRLFFLNALRSFFLETTLFLGLSRQVFSRKDEPRTRKTRAAAVTLHMLTEQLQVARAPFFYNRNEKLFFGTTLYLGLSRQVFSRKDEPRTRNTRAAAVTLHPLAEHCKSRGRLFFITAMRSFFLKRPFI